jgi:hypothetical protein
MTQPENRIVNREEGYRGSHSWYLLKAESQPSGPAECLRKIRDRNPELCVTISRSPSRAGCCARCWNSPSGAIPFFAKIRLCRINLALSNVHRSIALPHSSAMPERTTGSPT